MRITPYRAAVAVLSLSIIGVLLATFLPRPAGKAAKSAGAALPELARGFACEAKVNWQGAEYRVDFSCPASGSRAMTFLAPAALKGLCFTQDGSSLAISYDSLGGKLSADALPQKALFRAVLGAMKAAAGQGVKLGRTQSGYRVEGQTEAGRFTLTLSKSKVPRALVFPDLGLRISFSQFKFASAGK